jgi:preprotein translocase subunit YajC
LFRFFPGAYLCGILLFADSSQRKKEKEVSKMRSAVEVGDEIVTAGGIVGRVVSMKDDTIVVETGSDRSKIRIMRWAIQHNNTVHDANA